MPINLSTAAETAARLFDRFLRTGTSVASELALCDETVTKQIRFDASAATAGTASTLAAAPLGAFNLPLYTGSGQMTVHGPKWVPSSLTAGTSTTPSATTVYLTQIIIPFACSLTGIAVSNGTTVGTNTYVVALFNSAGTPVANSALAGTTTAGGDVYQSIGFTGAYAAATGVYWIALYVNGTTDRFRTIPAVGSIGGLAGSVTGQTFGTVAAVTLPTTFTADKGPVAYVY